MLQFAWDCVVDCIMGNAVAHGGIDSICSSTDSHEALCYNLHGIVLWIAYLAMQLPIDLIGSVCHCIASH